jgi:hypothetical protein
MSKMGSLGSFKYLKHKWWPKEGPGVELPIWLLTTKSRESTSSRCPIWECDTALKSSRRKLQLCFRPHCDPRSARKVMGLQSPERAPFGAISGLPLGSPGKNSHLDVASVESCRVYYKGEGGGFPQVRAVVSLVCPCCLWLVLAPRVFQLCTNHFVWVVCKPVWVTKACQLFLVPSQSFNPPLYPSKGCELGSVLRLLLFRCFLLGLTFEPFEELGVRQNLSLARIGKCMRTSIVPKPKFKIEPLFSYYINHPKLGDLLVYKIPLRVHPWGVNFILIKL